MAGTRIFALFNLKDGVDPGRYEDWAKATDIPSVNAMSSVDSFEVFRTEKLLIGEGKPPYGYIETIDVNDMDRFFQEVSTEAAQKVAGEFQSMVDVTFLVTTKLG